MERADYFVIQLPIMSRQPIKQVADLKAVYYETGLGCKDWNDCFTCPKEDCDWQAYPKRKRRIR